LIQTTPKSVPSLPFAKAKSSPGLDPLPVLTKFRGIGVHHALLVPGLVPDGLETFHRIRKHFLTKGNVSVLTYPYDGFTLETLFETIDQFLAKCQKKKRKPVLVGVSVGGGFLLEYLRRRKLSGISPALAGLVLVSPLTCVDDLAPILHRLWKPIVADDPTATQALEKGRSFFRQLASKSTTKREVPAGWKGFFAGFTPQGMSDFIEAPLRARIEKTLHLMPASGAILRCRILKELHGLEKSGPAAMLSDCPTLILWGSKERHTLNIDGPGVGTLCRPDLAEKHFPNVQIQWIYTNAGESVPHASLLKHDKAFARPLREFLARL